MFRSELLKKTHYTCNYDGTDLCFITLFFCIIPQVRAAQHAANAALATHRGEADKAADAVIQAADTVDRALQEQARQYRSIKSRMCTLLWNVFLMDVLALLYIHFYSNSKLWVLSWVVMISDACVIASSGEVWYIVLFLHIYMPVA